MLATHSLNVDVSETIFYYSDNVQEIGKKMSFLGQDNFLLYFLLQNRYFMIIFLIVRAILQIRPFQNPPI